MRTTLTSVAVLLFLACGAAHAGLIVNGGFETGNFTGWTVTGAGFNCGSPSGISNNTPHSGTYSACFGNPSALTFISQALATTPGQQYAVTFWYAQQPSNQTPSNEVRVSWDGLIVADVSNVPVRTWTYAGFYATASGTSTQLQFGFENGPGWFSLDDVQVDAVPEPGAVILCGLGLGLLGLLRRGARARSGTDDHFVSSVARPVSPK